MSYGGVFSFDMPALTTRCFNGICAEIQARPITLDAICSLSEQEWLRVPNFGKLSLQELSEAMRQHGRRLGDTPTRWAEERQNAGLAEARAEERERCAALCEAFAGLQSDPAQAVAYRTVAYVLRTHGGADAKLEATPA